MNQCALIEFGAGRKMNDFMKKKQKNINPMQETEHIITQFMNMNGRVRVCHTGSHVT